MVPRQPRFKKWDINGRYSKIIVSNDSERIFQHSIKLVLYITESKAALKYGFRSQV
jgi:hypothetical protein